MIYAGIKIDIKIMAEGFACRVFSDMQYAIFVTNRINEPRFIRELPDK